ncbi:hypothetical protein K493DRAFT_319404 [Basidiobolus meristosporus CBS 931.73]|uniref:RRM domain-containing protein n=1 Tax=Basidiobolus meristosporus CBS 931.73 TaxID=1314790 RepID=A0A1Y1XRY5_9FUNG|nr:hypothetical protein K493DRAFT_319404 [Basidiobolus meristosporus CBS 931.73]|eukprot:ORX88522.1 hypothetical protein K493DRAFT_319404 [Basidiobolus meristosporus CBS 931.73]
MQNVIEDITTIFVIGFPEDMQEREFQNMFTFCPGFEAATLKVPQSGDSEDGTGNSRKQIIGFAKFRSRLEALQARDVLNGRKVDADRGCVLKAEMAKKNLLTKRGLSNDNSSNQLGNVSINLAQALTPNGDLGLSVKKAFRSLEGSNAAVAAVAYDVLPCGPILPSDLLSPQPQLHEFSVTSDSGAASTTFDDERIEGIRENGAPPGLAAPVSRVVGYNSSRLNGLSSGLDTFTFPKFTGAGFNNTGNFFGNSNGLSGASESTFSLASAEAPFSGTNSSGMNQSPSQKVNSGDQNPPCNTLYVGNLPMNTMEEELRQLFAGQPGYKRLCFRMKPHAGPMCFVEFEDVSHAARSMNELQGHLLSNSIKGGIRLSYSKNPLGVRQ